VIIGLGVTVIAPVLPLALTMMPLNELVKKLSGVLF
jgi:threonine/homoserine efflux transporter RhtA